MSQNRASAHLDTGRLGENLARQHLSQAGYTIIAQNVRTPYGEIDLIARQGDIWIFVEVKTRRSKSLGPPEISMTQRKQTHLLNSIRYYCQQNLPEDPPWRIDVLSIQVAGRFHPVEIVHFENAVSGL
jgi:putative endonuclease